MIDYDIYLSQMEEAQEDIFRILDYYPKENTVVTYISQISDAYVNSYACGDYQSAYFNLHLLYMTYVYCSLYKISISHRDRYLDTILYIRPYNGSKVDLYDIKSIFDFSDIPEKDIVDLFSLVGVDKSYRGTLKKYIKSRNNMAHASGNLPFAQKDDFENDKNTLIKSIETIDVKMQSSIRILYYGFINKCIDEKWDSTEIKGQLETFVDDYDISKNDLNNFKGFSIKQLLSTENTKRDIRIKELKKELEDIIDKVMDLY